MANTVPGFNWKTCLDSTLTSLIINMSFCKIILQICKGILNVKVYERECAVCILIFVIPEWQLGFFEKQVLRNKCVSYLIAQISQIYDLWYLRSIKDKRFIIWAPRSSVLFALLLSVSACLEKHTIINCLLFILFIFFHFIYNSTNQPTIFLSFPFSLIQNSVPSHS